MKNINQAQAKTLVNKKAIPEYNSHWRAVGYLEALEKAKILEKALKTIFDFVDGELGEDAKEALAQWRKIK